MPTRTSSARTGEEPENTVEDEVKVADVARDDAPTGPLVAPESGDQKFRHELPTNDEPVISLTYGAEADWGNPVQVPPATLAPPEIILPPRAPDPVVAPLVRRNVTEEDLNSKGFKMLNLSAKQEFDSLVLRPGDRVGAGVEVVGLDDGERMLTLYPGAVVPEGQSGYVPTHYLLAHQLDRLQREAAKRRAEASAEASKE